MLNNYLNDLLALTYQPTRLEFGVCGLERNGRALTITTKCHDQVD
ncbi:hypothetical protein [Lacticaseibacillus casei]|nr:hypothetical protein [Lacticaseibacillus casei]